MVETTVSLPVVDLTPFLIDPTSIESLEQCQKAAEALMTFSACSIRDPRVSECVKITKQPKQLTIAKKQLLHFIQLISVHPRYKSVQIIIDIDPN